MDQRYSAGKKRSIGTVVLKYMNFTMTSHKLTGSQETPGEGESMVCLLLSTSCHRYKNSDI